ncbi:hypothetical protein SAMN06272771_5735 [Streptomyces sp. Ag82_O1-12]|nr:hypothetical protein SAMN06272771_5735 [Streptomyces sp. Ag82_O1-12]SOD48304.1 hypothetical protein SAMN06272727_5738 [Streptomyces sp. Ag82_G6-1]
MRGVAGGGAGHFGRGRRRGPAGGLLGGSCRGALRSGRVCGLGRAGEWLCGGFRSGRVVVGVRVEPRGRGRGAGGGRSRRHVAVPGCASAVVAHRVAPDRGRTLCRDAAGSGLRGVGLRRGVAAGGWEGRPLHRDVRGDGCRGGEVPVGLGLGCGGAGRCCRAGCALYRSLRGAGRRRSGAPAGVGRGDAGLCGRVAVGPGGRALHRHLGVGSRALGPGRDAGLCCRRAARRRGRWRDLYVLGRAGGAQLRCGVGGSAGRSRGDGVRLGRCGHRGGGNLRLSAVSCRRRPTRLAALGGPARSTCRRQRPSLYRSRGRRRPRQRPRPGRLVRRHRGDSKSGCGRRGSSAVGRGARRRRVGSQR